MGSKDRKRSKKASQGGKKKGDKKSRKKSAKKLRSYSESDDDSLISISSISNSSEEDVLRRRSRSRARKDVKGRKNRARSSSCSSDSSSGSLVTVKKRKSSTRKIGLGRKKKDGKKYKRAASLSSTSSDERDYEKSRGDLKKKKKKRRKYDIEENSKRKKKRNRARSISSTGRSSASDYEMKRKRYRSPSGSSLSMSSESEREWKRIRYWSPSGSSMSRGSKSRDQHIQDEIEVQNKPARKLNSIVVISARAEPDQNAKSKGLEHGYDTWHDERSIIEKGENLEEKRSTNEASGLLPGENLEEKKSTNEASVFLPGDEDLESILRLKALENMIKFRGGPKMSENPEKSRMSVTEVKQIPVTENAVDQKNTVGWEHSSSSDIRPIQNDSEKDRVLNVKLERSSGKDEVLATPTVNNKNPSFKKNVETETGGTESAQCVEDKKLVIQKMDCLNPLTTTDKSSNTDDDGVSRHNFISQPSKLSNVKAQSKLVLKSQGPLATCSVKDPNPSPEECINSKPVAFNCSTDSNTQVNEVNDKRMGDINNKTNIVKATIPESPSSSIPDSTSEQKKEDKEQSQFQEKTMTIMRGGELVQVSYKVYIPKKAPAASRRRLNR